MHCFLKQTPSDKKAGRIVCTKVERLHSKTRSLMTERAPIRISYDCTQLRQFLRVHGANWELPHCFSFSANETLQDLHCLCGKITEWFHQCLSRGKAGTISGQVKNNNSPLCIPLQRTTENMIMVRRQLTERYSFPSYCRRGLK